MRCIKSKRGAMEMSVGTLVTIVLLMIVLGLGVILVQKIFGGATDSVDSINSQIKSKIDNLFNSENKDLVVSLGSQNSGKVKQGTKNFGFVVGFAPGDAVALQNLNNCFYDISAINTGTYCSKLQGFNPQMVEGWFITGVRKVAFNDIQGGVAYDLIKMDIPDTTPTCTQRYNIDVTCGTYQARTFFDIEIVKKGFL